MKFQDHLGLDIGSKTIKLVQLAEAGDGKFSLVALGQADTPAESKDRAKIISQLVKDTKATTKQVVISLSESEVFTRVIEMPQLLEPELTQAIKWQAEQYVPVPLPDVVLKHEVLSQENNKMNVLLVAAPSKILNESVSLLSSAGLETMAIETEILAVARALVGADEHSPTTLLVHLGNETTTLSALARGDLTLTQSVATGGSAIARAVAAELGLEISQAEEYKRSYGLDETKLEGKVVTAIKPIVELILAEIKRVLTFYETRGGSEPIKRVVLTGGTALLPGLVQFFTENLNLEVQVGDPFLAINLNDQQRQEVAESGPLFATAVGLAMKPT
ncbi:type IV pilus assembly protein PilM [Candidatus Gottesmanbacteria bacterium]|nr:type IV pilus assembly protein PilM [Candidatus Gottesmanbacteria bacterium]